MHDGGGFSSGPKELAHRGRGAGGGIKKRAFTATPEVMIRGKRDVENRVREELVGDAAMLQGLMLIIIKLPQANRGREGGRTQRLGNRP